MYDFEERYYKLTKRILTLTGLWLNQSTNTTRLFHIAWYIVNLSLIIPMIIRLFKEYTNITIVLTNIFYLLFLVGGSIKFSITVFSLGKMRILYSKIASDWNSITNKSERAILERYNEQGLWLSKLYTIYISVAWLFTSTKPFLPVVIDLIIPLKNRSRPLLEPLYSDYYFFDHNDYTYWVDAYIAITYTFFWPFFSGFDSFFMLTVKHTCGLCAVTCYRIATTFDIFEENVVSIESSNDRLKRTGCKKNFKDAVVLHNDTIRSVELLEDSFNICFLVLIVMCTLGIAVSTTLIFYSVDEIASLVAITALLIGLIFYLFLMNWMGQQVINSSEQIFDSAYFSNWYISHPTTRKYNHIIMMRSYCPSKLTAGKLIDLSMETFEKIIKRAISYFTVFLSLI